MAITKVLTVNPNKSDSGAFFKIHWLFWRILGVSVNIVKDHGIGYKLYSLILNLLATICYPLHLSLFLFRSETQEDNINNLSFTVTCVACCLKFVIYCTKLRVILQFEHILQKLDERINGELELNYFRQLKRSLRNIAILFLSVYFTFGISAALSIIYREERSLLYPAWFPFDWFGSTWKFYVANIYQVVGASVLIAQNFVNDCFPAMALCVLSGHINMLSMRVANIGYDEKSLKDNEEELNRCIIDQNNLYDLHDTIENIISLPMFIQFCVTATSMCVSMGALLFYGTAGYLDIFQHFIFFIAMPLEIFPTCYYGSDFQYLFEQLHRAVFASNWTGQSAKYKKHMLLFTERSLKQTVCMAGGIVPIHLDTFFQTCRGAYSLFAILLQMK